jgi:formamidopyrimidine-DNA glycosylase
VPELPDIAIYLEALAPRVIGQPLERLRLGSPFVLRSVKPTIQEVADRRVTGLRRIGKRIVFELEGGMFVVIHLMITGRLHWRKLGAKLNKKTDLAAFDFPTGTLLLSEASSRKRASIHLVGEEDELGDHDRGGIEPLDADLVAFTDALTAENRTLKRALTDPRIFSGIGNAFSDEILHRARQSPFRRTRELHDADYAALHAATHAVLGEWISRLRAEVGDGFPEKVTAFRPEMAVHGRFGKPCPVCGKAVQRIVYAEHEANYCPTCQTGGRLLADRALSQLLRGDWPKTLEELEAKKGRR